MAAIYTYYCDREACGETCPSTGLGYCNHTTKLEHSLTYRMTGQKPRRFKSISTNLLQEVSPPFTLPDGMTYSELMEKSPKEGDNND